MLEEGLKSAVAKVGAHLDALEAAFVSRRALLELVMLGLLTREHVLLIGPPGTGKSAAVQALARALDAGTFDYLIGRFTEPGELLARSISMRCATGRSARSPGACCPRPRLPFSMKSFWARRRSSIRC
jgi:MoxR-like ATPase